jgi:hypothetical protein
MFLVGSATFYFSKKAWSDSYIDITTRSSDLSLYKKIFDELNEPCIILQEGTVKQGVAQRMKVQYINNSFTVEFEENINRFQKEKLDLDGTETVKTPLIKRFCESTKRILRALFRCEKKKEQARVEPGNEL